MAVIFDPKPEGPDASRDRMCQAEDIAPSKALRRRPVGQRVLVGNGGRGGCEDQRELATGRNLNFLLCVRGSCEHVAAVMISLAVNLEHVTASFRFGGQAAQVQISL